jgi:hypothetical protein
MAGMHHALMLTSRILAGIVGAFAFYCVTFMYENERGYLQNRLENLWIAIDDRANRQPGDRQDVPHPRTTAATYIKWIAVYCGIEGTGIEGQDLFGTDCAAPLS